MASKLPTITNKQKAQERAERSDSALKAMRRDYSRMRDIAVKRIKRAQDAGYWRKGKEIPMLKDTGRDPADLAYEYSRLSKFLESSSSSVKQLREESRQRVESFQKLGYTFVTEENELDFGDYMEYMINKYETETEEGKKRLQDSDIIVEAYDYIKDNREKGTEEELDRLFQEFKKLKGYED